MHSNRRPPAETQPPTPKGRDTRQRLLDSARRLFGHQGYAGVRISDITEAAGVSQGAFYRYFADRRALVLELLRELTSEAFDFVRVPWSARDPLTSVQESTLRYFEFFERNSSLFGLLVELAPTDPEIAAIGAASRRQFYGRIAHSLRRGVEAGVLREDLEVRVAAEMLGSISEFYAFQRFALADTAVTRSASVTRTARVLAEVWIGGVLRRDADVKK